LFHGVVKKSSRVADVDRSLDLVSSEDPNLDANLLQGDNSLSNIVLKLVFDGGRSDQLKFMLDLCVDHLKLLVTVDDTLGSFRPLGIPFGVNFFGKVSLREKKGTKADHCELFNVVHGVFHHLILAVFTIASHELLNDRVSTLRQKLQLVRLQISDNHRHSFASRVELKDIEKLESEFFVVVGHTDRHDTVLVQRQELEAERLGTFNEGELIGRRGAVVAFLRVNDNSVTKSHVHEGSRNCGVLRVVRVSDNRLN